MYEFSKIGQSRKNKSLTQILSLDQRGVEFRFGRVAEKLLRNSEGRVIGVSTVDEMNFMANQVVVATGLQGTPWLESQAKNVISEMPVYTWASGGLAKNEMMRMLYSLKHGKTLYNGYAGFYPPDWLIFTARLDKEFPSFQLESDLNEIGIDYVLVNKKEYGQTRLNAIKLWGEDKEVYQDKSFLVYKI